MRSLLTLSAGLAVTAVTLTARAQALEPGVSTEVEPLSTQPAATTTRQAPEPALEDDHPTPRLKLSYERFSAGNVDGSTVPLEALHLDLYALSWRWLRAGFEVEGGRGHASLYGGETSLKYGLLGVNAGFQIPGRVTPFFEGRLDGGVLEGSLESALSISGVSVSGASPVTYLYTRGLEGGVEMYLLGRSYLSLSVGWLRSTWGSADYEAMIANLSASLKLKDVTHDSLLFKIGLGI